MNDNAKRLLRSARDSAVDTHVREDIDAALKLLEEFDRDVPFRVRSATLAGAATGAIEEAREEEIFFAVMAALKDPND